jgi:hypothetical protein
MVVDFCFPKVVKSWSDLRIIDSNWLEWEVLPNRVSIRILHVHHLNDPIQSWNSCTWEVMLGLCPIRMQSQTDSCHFSAATNNRIPYDPKYWSFFLSCDDWCVCSCSQKTVNQQGTERSCDLNKNSFFFSVCKDSWLATDKQPARQTIIGLRESKNRRGKKMYSLMLCG